MSNDRNYTPGTKEALFMLSRGYSYEPSCKERVMRWTGSEWRSKVFVAHIRGLHKGSPRHDENMTDWPCGYMRLPINNRGLVMRLCRSATLFYVLKLGLIISQQHCNCLCQLPLPEARSLPAERNLDADDPGSEHDARPGSGRHRQGDGPC